MTSGECQYGSWKSPITSEQVVKGGLKLSNAHLGGLEGEWVMWTEGRPSEKGRVALCMATVQGEPTAEVSRKIVELSDVKHNVRTRVHEYGGAPYAVDGQHVVYSIKDGSLILRSPSLTESKAPTFRKLLDGPSTKLRFADGVLDYKNKLLWAVCEDHRTVSSPSDVKNTIAMIDFSKQEASIEHVAEGKDFYLAPRLSPDQKHLAFVAYDHPNMPWDATSLYLRDNQTGKVQEIVAGHSIVQPRFSPNGTLYWIDDSSGWWNLYSYSDDKLSCPIWPQEKEFGGPHWTFGQKTYDFVDDKTLVIANGKELGTFDIEAKTFSPFVTPFTSFSKVSYANGLVCFIGAAFDFPPTIATYSLLSQKKCESIRCSISTDLSKFQGYLSIPETIKYPTANNRYAFANYYPPTNKDYDGKKDACIGLAKPPLLVKIHGGPTSCARSQLQFGIQYWTSRGFAVADVNYGGSTGFGTEYRNRLRSSDYKSPGSWGIVDVQDCCAMAEYLVKEGKVHPKRLAITGGSAGGYTTLACLCFRDVFTVGASYYGVGDLEALARDTHKFESRYLDGLIGRYPQDKAVYVERSPLHSVDSLNVPMILFQGLEDKVVPPKQAESMYDAVKRKGLPVALVEFEGEGHGFRIAKNIRTALDGEYTFYCTVFGIKCANEEKITYTIANYKPANTLRPYFSLALAAKCVVGIAAAAILSSTFLRTRNNNK